MLTSLLGWRNSLSIKVILSLHFNYSGVYLRFMVRRKCELVRTKRKTNLDNDVVSEKFARKKLESLAVCFLGNFVAKLIRLQDFFPLSFARANSLKALSSPLIAKANSQARSECFQIS